MKIKLTLTKDGRVLDRYDFEDEEKIVIGRHDDCHVHIQNQGISRQHCLMRMVEGTYVLEDLGSSNGTFVRGKKISQHALAHGDVFSVVGVKITFESSAMRVAQAPDPSEGAYGMTLRVTPKATQKFTRAWRAQVSRLNGHMVIEEAKQTRIVILQTTVFQIGKDPKAELELDGLRAPRLAALILRDHEEFWLLDVSPKGNAIAVNGHKTRVHSLDNADMVTVFGCRFQFYEGLPRLEDDTRSSSGAGTNAWQNDP